MLFSKTQPYTGAVEVNYFEWYWKIQDRGAPFAFTIIDSNAYVFLEIFRNNLESSF